MPVKLFSWPHLATQRHTMLMPRREPPYKRSRFRYRDCRRRVEPIPPILAPAIEALGYTVEAQ